MMPFLLASTACESSTGFSFNIPQSTIYKDKRKEEIINENKIKNIVKRYNKNNNKNNIKNNNEIKDDLILRWE